MILFKHNISDDVNLSNFLNQALFYLSKMESCELDEIGFSFTLKDYHIGIRITNSLFNKNKRIDLDITCDFRKDDPILNSQIGIFNINNGGYASAYLNCVNEIIDQISLLIKCLYKIDKLKTFL